MRIFHRGLSFRKKRKRINLEIVKNIFSWILEIAIVVFAALVAVYYVGMRITVSGSSMETTLYDQDTVLVNRFIYNISSPKSGDVVAFLPNGNEKSSYYIKRVVAVPGDTVLIEDGVLYVNGELFDTEDVEIIETAGLAEEEVTVGEDEYFVLGDNRNSSEDSRYANIGNVKSEYIVGKVWFVLSPFSNFGFVD